MTAFWRGFFIGSADAVIAAMAVIFTAVLIVTATVTVVFGAVAGACMYVLTELSNLWRRE